MKPSLFNLEKIKEFSSPIEDLQINLNRLNEIKRKVMEKKTTLTEVFIKDNIINQYEELLEIIKNINEQLNKALKENLNLHQFYKDSLIKKYKESVKQKLMVVKLDENITKKIGVNLIETKSVSKIIGKISFIPSVGLNEWIDITESLNQYSIFLRTIKKASKFYKILINKKLNKNLNQIPPNTDKQLIEQYKQKFLEDPNLTFFQFIHEMENSLSAEDLRMKSDLIQKSIEKEEIDKLKKKQQEQQEAYENYLVLSNGEFERLRRRKKREKLDEVSIKQKSKKKIEIPEDISKKIEKFKSQFENSFNDKKYKEEDENKDPLDLIRERKSKKEKEYKKYKKHFENS
ncbi:MAG: hypothetical protein ACFE8E_00750 [Candidatus Hodarchaeota archaeon]